MTDLGAPEQTRRSSAALVLYWLRDLLLAIVIVIFIGLFLYQPVKVEGTSMMPALVDQERIFINKFAYKLNLSPIDRGDMIVFRYPGDISKSYVKRVIGIPGDVVEVDRGTVIVNGKRLDEAYVPQEYRDQQSMPAVKVRENEYFVLGDHRVSSNDSRAWGMVPRSLIYGKAVFVYWPPEKIGILN